MLRETGSRETETAGVLERKSTDIPLSACSVSVREDGMHASTFCHAEECYMAPREHRYDKGKKRHAVGERGNKKKRRTYIPTVLDELNSYSSLSQSSCLSL